MAEKCYSLPHEFLLLYSKFFYYVELNIMLVSAGPKKQILRCGGFCLYCYKIMVIFVVGPTKSRMKINVVMKFKPMRDQFS